MARRGNGEGDIHHRKDGRWEARIDVTEGGRRKRKSIYGPTQRDVQRKLTAALAARDQGLPVVMDGRLTVGAYLEGWLAGLKDRHVVRDSTWVSYHGHVHRNLIPVVGKVPLAKLTPQHVRQVHAKGMASGLSPRSIQFAHAVLRRALNQAMRDNLVARNVCTLEPAPSPARREMRVLDPDQARTLLAAAQGDRLEALYVVATALGLRQGEALGLSWADVDFDAGTVAVRHTLHRVPKLLRDDSDERPRNHYVLADPKTDGSARTVHAPKFVMAALKAHRVRQVEERLATGDAWDPEWDLVFATAIGTPLDGPTVTRAFQALLAQAGLPTMRFHDLRHSAATLMLVRGVDMRVVQDILGHASYTTTAKFYAHVLPGQRRDAASRMDDLFTATAGA